MTFFRTLNKEEGNIDLKKYYDLTRGGFVKDKVELIRNYVAEDNRAMVDKTKKSLPSVTVAGFFEKGRKAECFKGLTGMLVLDHDKLSPEDMTRLRDCYKNDPHVLMVNTSPSGKGLKVIVAYTTPDGSLPTTWEECKQFYNHVFLTIQRHYTEKFLCDIDGSGKDITRLNFFSYDAEACLNLEAEAYVVENIGWSNEQQEAKSDEQEVKSEKSKERKKSVAPNKEKRLELLTNEKSPASYLRRRELFYIICRNLYRLNYKYEVGARHHFMYMAVCEMNNYGIPMPEAMQMVSECLPQLRMLNGDNNTELLPFEEISAIVNDVYFKEKKKFKSKAVKMGLLRLVCLVVEVNLFMKLRHNVVSDTLEYIMLDDCKKGSQQWSEMTDRVENSLAKAMDEMECPVNMDDIRKLFYSDFVPLYDPIAEYLNSLPVWDGHDYMAELVDKLETDDKERVYKLLSMWYVGMIATYDNPLNTNEILIVFYTPNQGKGKTRFIDRMLPPQLRQLMHRVGYYMPGKDFERFIGTKLLIFIDEFQFLNREQHKSIQNYVSAKGFDNRRPYDRNITHDIHRASFIAACNNTNFMSNPDGNRRPHVIQLGRIDYDFTIDYEQLFAQLVHMWKVEKLKYYFDSNDQDELAELAHPYEHNTTEFELVRKYVRRYPSMCKLKQSHTSKNISIWLQKFDTSLEIGPKCSLNINKALGRRGYLPIKSHDCNLFECCLLTQEQVDYIAKYRDASKAFDAAYDKEMPRELLIADQYASEENMVLAKKCLDESGGDMKEATLLYQKKISLDGVF